MGKYLSLIRQRIQPLLMANRSTSPNPGNPLNITHNGHFIRATNGILRASTPHLLPTHPIRLELRHRHLSTGLYNLGINEGVLV